MTRMERLKASLECDPVRMCEILVGLPDVEVIGLDASDLVVAVHVECRRGRTGCPQCGVVAHLKDQRPVRFVDLPVAGRPMALIWHKRRWRCADVDCSMGSWTEEDERIASSRMAITTRAARWVTGQVGRNARSVNEVAVELGCDWHTVNDAVIAYGEALVDLPGRFATVEALGLDEVLFVREGPYRRQHFSTQIVDVGRGQLLDVVAGRKGENPKVWLLAQGRAWLDGVRFATLDLSSPYRAVFDAVIPNATQVADPFHVVKVANDKLDECRRRVQNETLGHRGHKHDPLYRCRRLLTKAHERIDDHGRDKLLGLLRAGDPRGEAATTWHADKRRSVSSTPIAIPRSPSNGSRSSVANMVDSEHPVEVRSLGRTLKRWRLQIAAWHTAQVSNGPTEAVNNLIQARQASRVRVHELPQLPGPFPAL